MESVSAPPVAVYRRVQLARWLIDNDKIDSESISYDNKSRITDFGIPKNQLDAVISDGGAFQTSGCPGADGKVACNRPYGNEKPGPDIRNFPFAPEPADLDRIRLEIFQY